MCRFTPYAINVVYVLLAVSPAVSAEMKLDLQKLSEEVFYAVPNSQGEVNELVDSTVDVYWEKRRYVDTAISLHSSSDSWEFRVRP